MAVVQAEPYEFELDPRAALIDASEQSTADALVMGFGRTRARPHSSAPVLTASADMTVAVNTEVMLTATATDTEDGTLTAEIEWENMAESFYIRQRGTGGAYAFTPPEPGKYPIHVFVKDSVGIVSEDTVMVTVTGTLPQMSPVQLVTDADTGAGITLSPDGLSAQYSVADKMAVRANQGIYGQFWYFEAQPLFSPVENVGTGLVVARGSLDPLDFQSTQPSIEVDFIGTVRRDLIYQAWRTSTTGYYGFAVDYRGDNPIVFIIVDNAVVHEITLDHVWVPLYPMLYGEPTTSEAPFDNAINFGATAFQFDPVVALTAHGVSTTELEVGWGDANTP